jgi:hypothetical protein
MELEAGNEYVVMGSHLPLTCLSATVGLFRGVAAVRKQLASAEGLVGYPCGQARWRRVA